jgi:hypothetical protein
MNLPGAALCRPHAGRSERLAPSFSLALLYACACILLASRQYTAVDGALRCLVVYWHRPPYLGTNNHLLFPADVWLWTHAAAILGVRASGPIAFLHIAQAMNAVCAGASIALVNALAGRLTGKWKPAMLAAVTFGLSWAMLSHATNSAEPVVGLCISLIAAVLIVEGLSRDRLPLLFIGGVCLALALSNYESMFLLAPLLYLLCLLWPAVHDLNHVSALRDEPASASIGKSAILRTAVALLGSAAGIATIYPAAYYSAGIRTSREMLRRFLQMGGEPEVYAGVRVSKLVNFPVGLIDNLVGVLPRQYQGLRWLLNAGSHRITIIALLIVGAVLAPIFLVLAIQARRLWAFRRSSLVGLFVVAIFIEILPLFYWDPMYDKLWLQPLAVGCIVAAVLGSSMAAGTARWFSGLILFLIALEATVNLPQVVLAYQRPTRCLGDAARIVGLITSRDKVVTDFDPVSTLWAGLYDSQPSRTMVFPATSAAVSLSIIDGWARECSVKDCRVLFISLLDQPQSEWDAFLGQRVKVPFSALDRYRQGSRPLARFTCENSSLRAYDPTIHSAQNP